MLTIAVLFFGITLGNFHVALPAAINAALEALKTPLQWTPSLAGFVLHITLGPVAAVALAPASTDMAEFEVPHGTVEPTPVAGGVTIPPVPATTAAQTETPLQKALASNKA